MNPPSSSSSRLFPALLLAATIAITSAGHAADGWINLFNGKNLDGWEQHSGTAKYRVEDGCIVGQTVAGTGNSFLCTKKKPGEEIRWRNIRLKQQ